jgi:hypothetical protein
MAYKVILPKKEKESLGGKLLRNATGSLVNFAENSENVLKTIAGNVSDPLALNQFKSKPRSVGVRDVAEQSLGKEYLKPKNNFEGYGQYFAGAVPVAAALGGTGLVSAAKHVASTDAVYGAAKSLGVPDSIATALSLTLPGLIRGTSSKELKRNLKNVQNKADEKAINTIKVKEDLKGIKDAADLDKIATIENTKRNLEATRKQGYEIARSNPTAKTNQKLLREGLQEGLDLEHKHVFSNSEANRKNLEGGLNLFRTDVENIESSIHKPQKYSNYDLMRDIKNPRKVDLDRNIILDDLFPKRKLINNDATLNIKKLESLYKDDIHLNDLFEFKKNSNAINYATSRQTSPALRNTERITQQGIENAGKQYPREVGSFRQADKAHQLLVSPGKKNENILKYISEKHPEKAESFLKGEQAKELLKNPGRKDENIFQYAAEKNPEGLEAFNKSSEIEKILSNPDITNKKSWEKAIHYLFKASKYLGIGKLIDRGYITKESLRVARPETKEFLFNNVIDKIKDNPAIFQAEIKQLNKLAPNKKDEKKKGKFKVIL